MTNKPATYTSAEAKLIKALNTKNLAIKPAVGGKPVKEIIKRTIKTPINGAFLPNPL